MKAKLLKVQITYNGEHYQNEFPYFGNYQPILAFAKEDWFEEVGSQIPNFDWDLYQCEHKVVPFVENVESGVVRILKPQL